MTKMKDSTFDMNIANGQMVVTRRIEFEKGDTISFNVSLQDFKDLTIAELHQKSGRKVIDLLEEWLKPPARSQ